MIYIGNGNTQTKYLKRYYEMLYPSQLKENEYVCLFMKKVDESGKEVKFHKFVKNFEQYEEMIRKYKHNFNIFNSLATVKPDKKGNLGRTKSNMRQKRVLYFDFDKKNHPNLKDAYGFTNLIKSKFPDMFIHGIYDSGHGCHCYVIVPPTCNIKDLTTLNKDIAVLVGADTKACQTTQVARVPCTFNYKRVDENVKYPTVKEIEHYSKHKHSLKKFHPCNIDYIKRRLANVQKMEADIPQGKPLKKWNYVGDGYGFKTYPSLCTEKILYEGADEHQRNPWLGRIVAMLLSQGYTESKIREMCLDWNTRCKPPKSICEVTNEINFYLDKKDTYKLNGCWDKISDPRIKEIVRKQCDKNHCMQAVQKTSISIEEDIGVKMAQKLLTKSRLQNGNKSEMDGYEYLILAVLYKHLPPHARRPFTIKDLKTKLQYKKSGKWQLCMAPRTFNATINSLVEHNCIELVQPDPEHCRRRNPTFEDKVIKMKRRLREFDDRYIEFYYSTARAFICRQISATEFKVFLCIINNIKNGKSCTLEDLDSILNIGRRNIIRAINDLEKAQCISIIQNRGTKGNWYNMYSHKHTDKWDDVTDIEKDTIEMDSTIDVPNDNAINEEVNSVDKDGEIVIKLLA